MSNNPVGIDHRMFKTLMRQTDILYKTLVGCIYWLPQGAYTCVLIGTFLKDWHAAVSASYSLYLFPFNKTLSLGAGRLVLCLIHVSVIHWSNCQQGCRKSKGESPGCTWGQYFIILSTLLTSANSTICVKQKISIFKSQFSASFAAPYPFYCVVSALYERVNHK